MFLFNDLKSIVPVLILIILGSMGELHAATITVTSNGDAIAVDGSVTLREAITSINNGSDLNADVVAVGAYGTNDEIDFSIGAGGVQSINPTSSLPVISSTPPLII